MASALAACVATGLPETVLPQDNTYVCRDGKTLHVARSPDGAFAIATIGGRSSRLMRMDSPAQEKYGDGPTTLYLDDQRAVLISDSFVVAGPCISAAQLPVTQPMQPR